MSETSQTGVVYHCQAASREYDDQTWAFHATPNSVVIASIQVANQPKAFSLQQALSSHYLTCTSLDFRQHLPSCPSPSKHAVTTPLTLQTQSSAQPKLTPIRFRQYLLSVSQNERGHAPTFVPTPYHRPHTVYYPFLTANQAPFSKLHFFNI